MGCTASALDHEQSITRCKDRKQCIKQAVRHRHALASAHAAYIQSLKNTGAAIRQFGDADSKEAQVPKPPPLESSGSSKNMRSILPPVRPDFLQTQIRAPPSPISRAVSMPPLRNTSSPSNSPVRDPTPQEEDEEEDEDHGPDLIRKGSYVPPDVKPPPPPPELQTPSGRSKSHETADPETLGQPQIHEHVKSENQEANGVAGSEQTDLSKNKTIHKFVQVLRELDDCFLSAFEKGKVVAGLLEARQVHYHSNFAGQSESLDHSSRVLRVMSWGRDAQLPSIDGERTSFHKENGKETHASILDKLLAWEKKLHDEVKAGERIRIELERKAAQLKHQKKRDENSETINKTKALVKSLHTRYLVEFQAVNAATSEVDKLRDSHLYKQLVKLVEELLDMWKHMLDCHKKQCKMIEDMQHLNLELLAPATSTDSQCENTQQLESEISLWHHNLERLMKTQKNYITSLYEWLRLHIIQIQNDGKDTPGSPKEMATPPIYTLCKIWKEKLDGLNSKGILDKLNNFLDAISSLKSRQQDERIQKRKVEELSKDLARKEHFFKLQEDRASNDGGNSVRDKERMLEAAKETLESETRIYEQLCKANGGRAISILNTDLPVVMEAILQFSNECCGCYFDLYNEIMKDDPIPRIDL